MNPRLLRTCALWLLPILALRAALPVGFMLSADGLGFCPAQSPRLAAALHGVAPAALHGVAHADHHSEGAGPARTLRSRLVRRAPTLSASLRCQRKPHALR